MRRLTLLAVAASALVGVAVGVVLHSSFSDSPAAGAPSLPALHGQATWRPGARPAPAIALRDQHGRRFSLDAERGRAVALTFMDSRCREACPVEGRMLAAAVARVPAAERPQVVVVSVNPEGDTPASVARAVRAWRLPPDVRWLLGSRRQLARVWNAYRITVDPRSGDIVHSTAVYLIDRRGDERAGFLMPFIPALVADDFRTLARS